MTTKNVLGFVSVLLLAASPVRAQAVQSVGARLEGELAKRVLWDEPGNGELWAAGLTYKASFTPAGTTFVPVLGTAAPRNTPVAFALASVTVAGEPVALGAVARPEHAGERVVFDHGRVREVWDARPTELEQTFELDLARHDGEVVVRLDVATELERVRDERGLAFVGEHGSVRYSNAVAWDARHAPVAIETRLVDGGIELVVPAAAARAAHGPIVIDPVITSYAVLATGATDDLNPDVAYDAVLAWQGVVVERAISATDLDCFLFALDDAGAIQGSVNIDTTNDNWLAPKVAHNQGARGFCVVSGVEVAAPAGAVVVKARIFYDTAFSISPQLTVADASTPGIGPFVFGPPDVGGDPSAPNTSGFCVVFDVQISATNHDVYGALISQGAVVSAPFPIANGAADDRFPSISKTNGLRNGVAQAWTVAWQREITVANHDIWAAKLSSSGSLVVPEFPVETSSANTFAPCVSSPTDVSPRRNLVTYTRNVFLGNPDIHGALIEGSTVVDTANLTALAGGSVAEAQSASSVDCDGRDFFVAWTETTPGGGGATDTHMATIVDLAGELAASGSVSPLGTFADSENQIEVCAARTSTGAPMRRAFAVWHWSQSGIDDDVYGASYGASPFTVYCNPGFDAAAACPCGNGPSASGRGCNNSSNTGGAFVSALGDPDADTAFLWAIALKPNNACIVLQGNAVAPAGVPFGDGVRCIDGQLLRMAVRAADASGMLLYPTTGDPSLKTRSAALGFPIQAGARTGYQVYYRDAQNFACATTFNVTNAVQVQW